MSIIPKTTYQAAHAVAAVIETHFTSHIAEAASAGEQNLAAAPDKQIIETIIDTAFWASLQREEGHSPKISIAFLPPGQAENPLLFKEKIPLDPYILTKLAPGVNRPGIHIGVWPENGRLFIWGTTLNIPNFCFVLDVPEPGLLVIKHRRIPGFGKFTNAAVLTGDQVKLIDSECASLPDTPLILKSLLGNSSACSSEEANVLIQFAVSMRMHGRGGTLLLVPAGSDEWQRSIIHPVKYTVGPAFRGLADLIFSASSKTMQSSQRPVLRQEIDNLAGLTAIDGAVIINDKFELLAFGAKIGRAKGSLPVQAVSLTEPVRGGSTVTANPSLIGGTRHLSAAQFVYDQHDAIALTASQDGRFTVFSWSEQIGIVQSHRIDILLL